MPIVKVPVQHKFGIVSLSRAEELFAQGRQKHISSKRSNRASSSTEITQAFISKYNATSEIDRENLDTTIKKSLLHAKHKAGLRIQSPASVVSPASSVSSVMNQDVSSAWLELTLLCQCYGQYQQEVLVTLATSLNRAQLSISHIPSLFYIAGLCYQWLKSDVIASNLLRSGELLLLKILYLVSIRIYFHHLTGSIIDTCTRDEVRQFKFDLEGFENREKAYRNFPEALLHWKVSLEVGLLICENYSKPLHDPSALPLTPSTASERSQRMENTQKHETLCPSRSQSRSLATPIVKHGGHHLSPILWHSLDVWQCARQGCDALNEAIEDLLNCSTEFESEKWLEGLVAMDILCAASQFNLSVLYLVQSLAEGSSVQQHQLPTNEQQSSIDIHSQPNIESLQSPKQRTSDAEKTLNELISTPTKQPRFILSSQGGSPNAYGNKLRERQPSVDLAPSTPRVNTLNVLGMQPDFDESYTESAVQTLTYSGTGDNHMVTASEETTSKEENSQLKLSVQRSRFSEYSSALTVGTQSLIDNETIPDTPPSRFTSNATMLFPLDSTSTLDRGVSMVKSTGLIASSNSKTLNAFSTSNPMFIANVSSASSRNELFDTQTVKFESTEPVSQLLTPTEEKMATLGLTPPASEIVTTTDHQEEKNPNQLVVRQRSHSLSIPGQSAESQCTHYTHSTAPLSGGAGIPGSQVPPSTTYRHSVFSSLGDERSGSLDSLLGKNQSQFEHWPIEVSIMYTLNMASVVIYGRSSIIQKTALEGKTVTSEEGDIKYGLLQLSEYTTHDEETSNDHSKESSCWSVRHAALLGLSRVCKVCHNLPMKDGLSSVAWSKLMQRHSLEKEDKVLEAYKISQSYPDTDGPLLPVESQSFSSPLSVHIANGLSQSFLPPVTPAPDVVKQTTKRTTSTSQPQPPVAASKQLKNIPAKVQTRQDMKGNTLPDYITRTTGALNKIAEEHWRRQMEKELEEEKKNATMHQASTML